MAGSSKNEKRSLTIVDEKSGVREDAPVGSWDRFVIQGVKAAEMTKEQVEKLENIIVQEVKTATGKDPEIVRIQDSVVYSPK